MEELHVHSKTVTRSSRIALSTVVGNGPLGVNAMQAPALNLASSQSSARLGTEVPVHSKTLSRSRRIAPWIVLENGLPGVNAMQAQPPNPASTRSSHMPGMVEQHVDLAIRRHKRQGAIRGL